MVDSLPRFKMEQSRQIKVAAFDAPKGERDSADFRCDGVADDVEINAAIHFASNVSLLRTKYGNNKWFQSASEYLTQKYAQVEARIENTFRFVTLAREHGSVYSYEFSSILRDAGSLLSSLLDTLVRNAIAKPKKHYDFHDYCIFLRTTIPDIHRRVVAVDSLFPMILIPFSALSNRENRPRWWFAYTKVKHAEVNNCKHANQSNALASLAALAIIGSLLGCFIRTRLFVNVGLVYPTNDPAVQSERVLFDSN